MRFRKGGPRAFFLVNSGHCAFVEGMTLSLDVFRDLPILKVAAGEDVIGQGTSTGKLFILIEGKVDVIKDEKSVATSSQPGDIFGDISALLSVPHTTSVRAVKDSSFYVAEHAREFLEKNPTVCMHLCELIARRLVSVTEYLVNLKEQYAGHDHIGMVDDVLDSLIHRHPRKRVAARRSSLDVNETAD